MSLENCGIETLDSYVFHLKGGTMAYKAGKFGKVSVGVGSGAQEIAVTGWKCKHVSDDLDTTSTESQGFREYQDGLEHLELTIDAEWDATLHPGVAPLDIQTTKFFTNVELYVDRTGSAAYTIPLVKISDIETDLTVDAVVKWSCNGKSSGSYTVGA